MHPQVLEEMMPYFIEATAIFQHTFLWKEAKKAMDKARERVALGLGAKTEEIYFTGSGTEADNWAVKAPLQQEKEDHIITTN